MEARADIVIAILEERERQKDLPGSEWDVRNTPNDWCAIAAHYLLDEVRRGGRTPARADFQRALVKAAAVIVAALEQMDSMDGLRDEEQDGPWMQG